MNPLQAVRFALVAGLMEPWMRRAIERQAEEEMAEMQLRVICPPEHLQAMLDLADRIVFRSRADALRMIVEDIARGDLP